MGSFSAFAALSTKVELKSARIMTSLEKIKKNKKSHSLKGREKRDMTCTDRASMTS
jgi:hypothetical protein